MTLYLDASVLVALMVNEPTGPLLTRFLTPGRNQLVISDFAVAEGSAAVAKLARMGLRTPACADEVFDRMDAWVSAFAEQAPITTADVMEAIDLVRRHDLKLRAPDAIHVAAAVRLDITLVTLDRGMARAATALGLPCINPADLSAL